MIQPVRTQQSAALRPSGAPVIPALMLFPFRPPCSARQLQQPWAFGISTINFHESPPGIARFRRSTYSDSMQRLPETTSAASSENAVFALIRKAAEETLAVWPEAMAAVLFGSRARGDHLPSSDWDIAFITGCGGRIGRVPSGLPILGVNCEVDCLKVPEAVARRNALTIGHLGREVIRDGRLLAGSWNRPSSEGTAMIGPDEYARLVRNAITHMVNAVARVIEIGETGNRWDDLESCSHFVAESANSAGHSAKAKLGRHGIDHERTHDLNRLADQAERAGFARLARDVRSMNGLTGNRHMATYGGVTVEDCRHATGRFLTGARLLAEEIRSAKHVPFLAGVADELARKATISAGKRLQSLQEAPPRGNEPGRLPPDRDPVAVLVLSRAAIANALGELSTFPAPGSAYAGEPARESSARQGPKSEMEDDLGPGYGCAPSGCRHPSTDPGKPERTPAGPAGSG